MSKDVSTCIYKAAFCHIDRCYQWMPLEQVDRANLRVFQTNKKKTGETTLWPYGLMISVDPTVCFKYWGMDIRYGMDTIYQENAPNWLEIETVNGSSNLTYQ